MLLTKDISRSRSGPAQQMRFLMNTFVRIAVYDDDRDKAHEAITQSFKEIKRLEQILSRFREDSDIWRINQSAGNPEPIRVTPETIEILKEAIRISRLSNGAFDPTITPLINLWASATRTNRLPDDSGLEDILPLINYRLVEMDQIKLTVRLPCKGMSLDLGGIAKGYAIDRVVSLLKSCGVENALIDVGGNIFVLTNTPDNQHSHPRAGQSYDTPVGRLTTTGIQHPLMPEHIIGTVVLRNEAIATSASYERFFRIGGKEYSHIINPKTGKPAGGDERHPALMRGSPVTRSSGEVSYFEVIPQGANRGRPVQNTVRLFEQSELQPTIPGSNSLRSNCQSNVRSVSIISSSAILGDALSTAFFVSGLQRGIDLISRFPETSAVIIYETEKNQRSQLQVAYSSELRDRVAFISA